MRKGFTLLDTLICIGIIALLAAIMFPTFVKVKEQAIRTGCESNLLQLAIATELYRQENSGTDIGSPNEMGFPTLWAFSHKTFKAASEFWCPERNNNKAVAMTLGLGYHPFWCGGDGDECRKMWESAIEDWGDSTVIWIDLFHNPSDEPLDSADSWLKHVGLGVTIAGTAVRINNYGDWSDQSWWHPGTSPSGDQ